MAAGFLQALGDGAAMDVLEALGHGVVVTDMNERVLYLNQVAQEFTGRTVDSAVGETLATVLACVDPADRRPVPIQLNGADCGTGDGMRDGRLLLRADGGEEVVTTTVSPVCNVQGARIGYVVLLQDARRLRDLAYQATHDPLTGLVNRREFERRLALAVTESQARQATHAFCFLDLDCFKSVNDRAGHAAGDAVLGQLASRMRLVLRDGDTIGRLGGDEFGILLHHCPLDTAVQLADGLRELVERCRLSWSRQTLTVGVSIGVVAIDGTPTDATTAFRMADAACYFAKKQGRNAVQVYSGDSWDHAWSIRRWWDQTGPDE